MNWIFYTKKNNLSAPEYFGEYQCKAPDRTKIWKELKGLMEAVDNDINGIGYISERRYNTDLYREDILNYTQ